MPILPAIRRGAAYLWDRTRRLFRAAADRKPVPPRTVRLALDDVLDAGAQRLRGLSKQCAAGKRSTAEWVAGVRSELTSLHLAARLAAIGGIAQWSPEHTQAAATTLAGQFGYLNRFADQVDAGDVDPDSSGFADRTASYADAARVLSYEDPRRQQEALGGSRWERRVLDPQADNCDGCRAAADDGWVPIGTSPAIGTLDCGQRCRCHVDYSSDEASPDDEDFGVSRVIHTDAVQFEGTDDSGPEPFASVVFTEAIEFADGSDGHWVTLDEGQHVFITSGGEMLATHDAINKHFRSQGAPEKAGNVIADKPSPGTKAPVKRAVPKAAVPAGPAQPIGQRIRDDRAGDAIIDRLRSIEETTSAKTEAYESARSAYNKYVLDSSLEHLGTPEGQARRVELETAGLRAKAEYDQAQQSIRSQVGAALAVANPVSWSHEHPYAGTTMDLDPERRAALEEARSFVEPIVAAGGDTRHAIEWNQIPSQMQQRSRSSFNGKEISLGTDADAGTAVHEWGHVIEQQMPGARAAALEFLAHRVGSEPITSFAEIEPGAGYRSDEGGRKDNFHRAFGIRQAYYVGKSYGDRATEIIAMGIEKLYRDPLTFARKDPEYAKFVIGVLQGRLR